MLHDLLSKTSSKVETREEWNRVQKLGHTHWIVWKGFLGLSLPIGLIVHFTIFLTGGVLWTSSVAINVGVLFLWLIAGYLTADLIWHQLERRYDEE